MGWPTPQDYNEAVQSPKQFFSDPELRAGKAVLNALGLPKVISGAFASVYRFRCKNRDLAVRCFLHCTKDIEQRYREISDFVMHDNLPYTVSFEYQKEGILIGGHWYPLLKMDWVEGQSLLDYVAKNAGDPGKLSELLDMFDRMILDLKAAGIAHGDLQHGNILVVGNELRLVDYDGMFVPALAGWTSNELGHRNYQHPERQKYDFGPYLDNFSVWVIRAALKSLILDSSIWHHFPNDECLLFRHSDFLAPSSSKLLNLMLAHKNAEIRDSARLVNAVMKHSCPDIPFFDPSVNLPDLIARLGALKRRKPPEFVSAGAPSHGLWSRENMKGLIGDEFDLEEHYDQPAASDAVALTESSEFDEALARASLKLSPEQLLLSRARGLVNLRMYKEAEEDLASLATIYPDSLGVHLNLAMVLLYNKKSSECYREFERAIKINPEYAKTYYLRGMALQQLGNQITALGEFEKSAGKTTDSELRMQCWHQSTLSACALGRYKDAVDFFHRAEEVKNLGMISGVNVSNEIIRSYHVAQAVREIMKNDADIGVAAGQFRLAKETQGSFSAHLIDFGLAYCDAMQGKAGQALIEFERLEKLGFNNKLMLCTMGNIYLANRHLSEAKRSFRNALMLDSKYTKALFGKGQVLLLEGLVKEAQELFEAAFDLPAAHIELAKIAEKGANYDLAGSEYAKAAALDRSDIQSYVMAGRLYLKADNPAKAHATLNLAITRKRTADGCFFRAIALVKLREYETAIADLQECIRIDPRYAEAHYNLGSVLHKLGRNCDARNALSKSLEFRPDWIRALKMRAGVNYALNEFAVVLADCDAILLQEPNDLETAILKAKCYQQNGDYAKAASALEFLPSSYINDERDWTLLAESLLNAGLTASFNEVVQEAYNRKLLLKDAKIALEICRECVRMGDKAKQSMQSGASYGELNEEAIHWYQRAVGSYNRYCNLEPRGFCGFSERAGCHRELGHIESAVEDYEKVITLGKKHSYAGQPAVPELLLCKSHFWLAVFEFRALEEQSQYLPIAVRKCDAHEHFDYVLSLMPSLADCRDGAIAWRWRGLAQDDNAQALESYAKAIALDPQDGMSYLRRAQLLMKMTRFDDALQDVSRIENESLQEIVELSKGECLYNLKRYQESVEVLTPLLEASELFLAMRGRYFRALCFEELEKFKQALDDFSVLLIENKGFDLVDVADVCSKIIDIFAKQGKKVDALTYFEEFVPASTYFDVSTARANLRLELGDEAGALQELNELIKIVRTKIRRGLGSNNSPMELSSQSLAPLLIHRAKANLCLRKNKQGRRDLAEAVSFQPKFELVQKMLECLIAEKKYREAIVFFEDTRILNESSSTMYELYSIALSRTGEPDDAARAYKRAQELLKKDP